MINFKKNVLYILSTKNYGGAEIVIRRLINANRAKVDPVVFCPPGEFSNYLKSDGTNTIEIKNLNSLELKKMGLRLVLLPFILFYKIIIINFKLNRELRKRNYHAIHANNLSSSVYIIPVLIYFKFIIKKRLYWIWSNHDLRPKDQHVFRLLTKACIFFYDKTIAVSLAVKTLYKFKSQKVSVLYNGLDLIEFKDDERNWRQSRDELAIQDKSIVIGILGTISRGKGQELLLTVFQKLLRDYNNVILLIVGPPSPNDLEYFNKIKNTKDNLEKGRIIITGRRNDIPYLLNGLDILVNSTTTQLGESLGTTIYEAMACKKIVIASDVGGTTEIIDDKINGFIFKPENENDLFVKLKYVIDNFQNLTGIREAARNKVEKRFNLKKMVDHYNILLGEFKS